MRDFPVNLYLGGPGIEQIIFGVFQEQAAGPTTAVGAGGRRTPSASAYRHAMLEKTALKERLSKKW